MKLADVSIRRPVTTFMLMVAMVVFGLIAYKRLPINLLPNISYPTLTVRTDYPGTSPHEVETLVSKPIEDAVGVIPGVVHVSSISRPGRSDVIVEFAWKTDIAMASLDIRERLDMIRLPDDAKAPMLLRFDPSLDPIMRIGLTGDDSLVALRIMAEDELKPALESLATENGEGGGVAAVKVSGGLEEEIHVNVNEAKLARLRISVRDVVSRLAQENVNLTGGILKDGRAEFLVRTVNEFANVDDIANIRLVTRQGRPVCLKDVASVVKSHRERTVITRIDGRESVELAVYKEADANTVSVANLVKKALKDVQRDLERRATTARVTIVSDQSRFIQQSIDEVLSTAKVGGLLAIAILYLFLRHFGSTIIVGVSIPLSVVATFFFMYTTDVTLNVMSLGGLALGIGMLVDNAIVVLESIARCRDEGMSALDAASKGTDEVGRAVVASTLTTVCVFFPIVFVQGIAGQLFQDQALTVTASLMVSLFVALTFIPMLASLPIWGRGHHDPEGERASGSRGLFHPAVVSVLVVCLFAGGAAASYGLWRTVGPRPVGEALDAWKAHRAGVALRILGMLFAFFLFASILSGGIVRIGHAFALIGRELASNVLRHLMRLAVVLFLGWLLVLTIVSPERVHASLPKAVETGPAFLRGGKPEGPTLKNYAVQFGHATIDRFSNKTWGGAALVLLGFYLLSSMGGGMLAAACIKIVYSEIGRVFHALLWPFVFAFNLVFSLVARAYPGVVRAALANKPLVLVLSVAALWLCYVLYGRLGSELIPELSQGEVNIDYETPVGTPLARTLVSAERLETMVRADPAVAQVYTIVGTTGQTGGYASDELEHIGQINVRLKPGLGRAGEDAMMARLRDHLHRNPIAALTYKFSRPSLFSYATPIEIEVRGYNLLKLEAVSRKVVDLLARMRGLTDVKTSLVGGNPELQVIFDREKTARLGLNIASIASIIRANVEGDVATELSREDRQVDIRVQARKSDLRGVPALERLTVNPGGKTPIPLASVARVVRTAGPNEIRRIGGERVALVTANLRGRDLKSAVAEIEARLPAIEMPRDFDARVSGQSREMSTAFNSMRFAITLAAFLVYLVMASQFESLLHPFVIMFTIPFALIGVVLALWLTHTPISVLVLIGVVMLAGIVVNNAIVLVDCINSRMAEGMARREAIVEAGSMRLRPILMTTATTVLGLLPMALGLGQGSELRQPMAITVIGGLLTSTLLTLLFVPTVYDVVEGAKQAFLAGLRRLSPVADESPAGQEAGK